MVDINVVAYLSNYKKTKVRRHSGIAAAATDSIDCCKSWNAGFSSSKGLKRQGMGFSSMGLPAIPVVLMGSRPGSLIGDRSSFFIVFSS